MRSCPHTMAHGVSASASSCQNLVQGNVNACPQACLAYYLYDLPFDVGPAGCYSDHLILCIPHPGPLCHDNDNSATTTLQAKKCEHCALPAAALFLSSFLSGIRVALLYSFLSGIWVALPLFDCHASRMAGSRGSVSLSCLPDDRKSWLCSIVRVTVI